MRECCFCFGDSGRRFDQSAVDDEEWSEEKTKDERDKVKRSVINEHERLMSENVRAQCDADSGGEDTALYAARW
jgi:hypothetical protein